MAKYKWPRDIEILKELPKGPTGKILNARAETPRGEGKVRPLGGNTPPHPRENEMPVITRQAFSRHAVYFDEST
jgi:hypothetical protein